VRNEIAVFQSLEGLFVTHAGIVEATENAAFSAAMIELE
jgi:hypothetical protein